MSDNTQILITLLQNLLTSDVSTPEILRACLSNKRLSSFCDTGGFWIQLLKRDFNFDYYKDDLKNSELGYCDWSRYTAKDVYTQILIEKIVNKLVDVHEAYILIDVYERYLAESEINLPEAKKREDFIDNLLKLFFGQEQTDQYVCINNIVVPAVLLDDIERVIEPNINPGSVLALHVYYDYLYQEREDKMSFAKEGEYNKYGMNFP